MRLFSDLDCDLCKLAKACDEERVRKPYSGNLYVRFDEGSSGVIPAPTLPANIHSNPRCDLRELAAICGISSGTDFV